MTIKEYIDANNDNWAIACKLLDNAARWSIGLHVDEMPDTPEMDELRHSLLSVVEDYKHAPSEERMSAVKATYNEIKRELSANIADYVL